MNRIRPIRERAGISQADLYKALGWKQSRLANYEAGNRTPGLNEAREIVLALNLLFAKCSLEDVFPDESSGSIAAARPASALNRNLQPRRPGDQEVNSTGRLSSTAQASP